MLKRCKSSAFFIFVFLMNIMQYFVTDRLILRPAYIEDAPFIFKLMNSPKWLQFIGDRHIISVEAAERYILEKMVTQFDRLGYGNYIIVRKSDEMKIGTVGLFDRDGVQGIDIGFAMLPQFERHGYASEAAQRIMQAAKEDFDLKEISAITAIENTASQKLLEKLGLQQAGTIVLHGDDEELILYKWTENN